MCKQTRSSRVQLKAPVWQNNTITYLKQAKRKLIIHTPYLTDSHMGAQLV